MYMYCSIASTCAWLCALGHVLARMLVAKRQACMRITERLPCYFDSVMFELGNSAVRQCKDWRVDPARRGPIKEPRPNVRGHSHHGVRHEDGSKALLVEGREDGGCVVCGVANVVYRCCEDTHIRGTSWIAAFHDMTIPMRRPCVIARAFVCMVYACMQHMFPSTTKALSPPARVCVHKACVQERSLVCLHAFDIPWGTSTPSLAFARTIRRTRSSVNRPTSMDPVQTRQHRPDAYGNTPSHASCLTEQGVKVRQACAAALWRWQACAAALWRCGMCAVMVLGRSTDLKRQTFARCPMGVSVHLPVVECVTQALVSSTTRR